MENHLNQAKQNDLFSSKIELGRSLFIGRPR